MKSIKSLLREQRGAFSLLYVIVTFIACIVAIGFTDMMIRSYTMDELQSNMDIAGVSSLQTGVDKENLRLGIFEMNRQDVEMNYIDMLNNRLSDSDRIESYSFQKVETEVIDESNMNDKGKWGLGETNKKRPQVLLDSVMVITVDNSQMFDLIPGAYKSYYNSFDGSNVDVNYLGKNEDGKVELSVRSVSRLVYR